MNKKEAQRVLAFPDEEGECAQLPASILPKLVLGDIPEGVSLQVGMTRSGVLHLDWSGRFFREGDEMFGEADYTWIRKYWYSPLGLEQYMDLVRRTVEIRHRLRGDVQLAYYDDDGAYVQFLFRIRTSEKNVGAAYNAIKKIAAEMQETADGFVDEIGQRISEIAARLSGWGSENLDALVDAVEKAQSADDILQQFVECRSGRLSARRLSRDLVAAAAC